MVSVAQRLSSLVMPLSWSVVTDWCSMAHFQEEPLEQGDDGGFDIGLGCGWIFREAKEFKDVGVLDEVTDGGRGLGRLRGRDGVLSGKQALVAAGFDLALELANAPVFPGGLLQVAFAGFRLFLSHNQSIMDPDLFAGK